MDIKKTFGTILTILGIIGICYGAFSFIKNKKDWTNALIVFVVSGVFFTAGIGLVKSTPSKV